LFAAGDTVFIQNLGTANLTITAGTATVNTAGSLILPQYDAGILYFVSASSAVFYDYIQVGAAGGKILQVVSTTDNTLKQVTNATEYTEIATAITPSSASSKILVMVSIGLSSNSTNSDAGFRIKRNTTAIQQGSGGTVNINASFYMGEGSSEGRGQTIQLIDSPATTSAITYKMELLTVTGTININRRGLDTYYAASSSMTLMEIGA
jgi:hypothetical protein